MSKYDKLFHIRKDVKNRVVPLVPVLDDEGKFHMWVERGDDFIELGIIRPYEGDYFAKKPYSEKDVYFDFMNFMYQRSTRKDIFPLLQSIRNDIHNLATCLRKLEVFHELRNDEGICIGRFVITEIEYIFGVCRSLFDLLQLIAKKLWSEIKLSDEAVKKKELKDSFADMALKGEKIRTAEELQEKYGLSTLWSKFYAQEAPFFRKIRKYRNDIEHHGSTTDFIFSTDEGFAIRSNYEPFSSFNVWRKETFLPNNLAPIKPIIAYVIRETLAAMGRFVNMLSKEIRFPEDIAPGYFLFMRGPHIHKLAELRLYIEDNVWYLDI